MRNNNFKLQSILSSAILLLPFITQTFSQTWDQQQNTLNVQPLRQGAPTPQYDANTQVQPAAADPSATLAVGQEKFALGLYHEIAKIIPNKNFLISPFSIWSLLVLVTEGATGNTYRELIRTLGLPDDQAYLASQYRTIQNYLKINTSSAEIYTSQALILDRKLVVKPRFAERVSKDYKSDLVITNFDNSQRAISDIEMYMRQASNGRIGNILTEDDVKNAQMVMISSILFDAKWQSPFNMSNTKREPFYDESNRALGDVEMMFQQGAFAYTAMAELQSHLLELPYGNKDLSMIIILPRKEIQLHTVIARLQSVSLAQMFLALRKAEQEFEDDEVEVHIPRFSVQSDLSLAYILEEMGVRDLFDAQKANLEEISANPTFLSQIVHKVKIRVNEEGTYASATTAAVFSNKATPPRFYANRPFLYLIVEKNSNTVLFLGQIFEPEGFRA